VQFGRQVKTVRPKIPVSGMVDASLGARSVTLKVNVGVEGNVTAASIVKSSGSNDLDQPTLVAMYDWWFEPLKDKKGRPVPDVVFFTITFR
jgi:TonB family protein